MWRAGNPLSVFSARGLYRVTLRIQLPPAMRRRQKNAFSGMSHFSTASTSTGGAPSQNAAAAPRGTIAQIQPTSVTAAKRVSPAPRSTPLISGVLRGAGDTRFAAVTDVGCIWAMVPLGAAAAFWLGAPPVLVLAVLKCDMPLKAFFCLRRIAGGNWIRNVTR